MGFIPENRWQAFGVHITISLLIFLVLASVIYFFWYPGFLFWYDGGVEGIKLIAGVDFLIGPILTLCVYKLGKKALKFDLAVIALLQIGCLVGGMWTVWLTRPVAVVYSLGQFRTVSYGVYKDYGVKVESVSILDAKWPVWVAVKVPDDKQMQGGNWKARFYYENELNFKTEYYVPFESYADKLKQEGKSPADIIAVYPELSKALSKYPDSANVYRFACGAGVGYLVMDKDYKVLDAFTTMTRKTAYDIILEKLHVKLVQFGYLQR